MTTRLPELDLVFELALGKGVFKGFCQFLGAGGTAACAGANRDYLALGISPAFYFFAISD